MTLSKITDGAESTLLISENVQAGVWYDTRERLNGMLWHPDPNLVGSTRPDPAIRHINVGRNEPVLDDDMQTNMARPSSNHPGGVLVAYASNKVEFLSEEIDYKVYCLLMTSDTSKVWEPGFAKNDPAGNTADMYPWIAVPLDAGLLNP